MERKREDMKGEQVGRVDGKEENEAKMTESSGFDWDLQCLKNEPERG